MNVANYINSGILMDYCLGLISEEDRKSIEQNCLDYPEIAIELKLLQKGLERYAAEKTTWRKEELKNKIWSAIDKINREEQE